MTRLLVVVSKDEPNGTEYVDLFTSTRPMLDGEEALRNAVTEYLDTEEGKAVLDHNCGVFTWGDALDNLPNEILSSYGIWHVAYPNTLILDEQSESVFVDYNEMLHSESNSASDRSDEITQ